MSYSNCYPVRNMNAISKNWNNMFEEFFRSDVTDDTVERVWVPRVDIIENEGGYKVYADLPGMVREDLNIDLEDGVLTINGERKRPTDSEKDVLRRNERAYGKFSRSFRLRDSIDVEKIDASFKDGVLVLTLPMLEKALPRKIEISMN